MPSSKIEFEAIHDRPGLYKYELMPPVNCFPGQWHLLEWDISKPKLDKEGVPQVTTVLGTKVKDAVGAKVLVYMHRAFMACPEDKGEELIWIGVSKTRLIEDNAITDKPIKKQILLIVIDRLHEEGFLAVAKDGNEEVLFPTAAMIMAMIQGRIHPEKKGSEYSQIGRENKAKQAAAAAT